MLRTGRLRRSCGTRWSAVLLGWAVAAMAVPAGGQTSPAAGPNLLDQRQQAAPLPPPAAEQRPARLAVGSVRVVSGEQPASPATPPSGPLDDPAAEPLPAAPSSPAGPQRIARAEPSATPATPDTQAAPLPLAPPSPQAAEDAPTPRPKPTQGKTLRTVMTSLALVLVAFFGFIWLSRRAAPQRLSVLPGEALEVLGRAPLAGRQQLQLVRIGDKLVLLAVTATTATCLTEITDPRQVERLMTLCQREQPNSVTQTFRQVLNQMGSEPAQPGFLGAESVAPGRTSRNG